MSRSPTTLQVNQDNVEANQVSIYEEKTSKTFSLLIPLSM